MFKNSRHKNKKVIEGEKKYINNKKKKKIA
jgi:hypothetical protein